MNLIKKLKMKGLHVEIIENSGIEYRKQLEEKFAKNLSEVKKEEIYFDQFLWHLFSYQQVKHFSGQDAKNIFNTIDKSECVIFYQHDDLVLKIENANDINAKDLENEKDIYIVNKNMTWTYVNTHEYSCGPYFYNLNIH